MIALRLSRITGFCSVVLICAAPSIYKALSAKAASRDAVHHMVSSDASKFHKAQQAAWEKKYKNQNPRLKIVSIDPDPEAPLAAHLKILAYWPDTKPGSIKLYIDGIYHPESYAAIPNIGVLLGTSSWDYTLSSEELLPGMHQLTVVDSHSGSKVSRDVQVKNGKLILLSPSHSKT